MHVRTGQLSENIAIVSYSVAEFPKISIRHYAQFWI